MPIKKYESIAFAKLSIPIKLGSKAKRIEFKGGVRYPKRRGGTFVTDDVRIQKALERNSGYNRKFKRVSSDLTRGEQDKENAEVLTKLQDIPAAPPVIAPPVVEPIIVPPIGVPIGVPIVDITEIIADEVTKFQEGKNFLLSKFPDLNSPGLRSKALVREVAAAKGVTFPNWIEE